MLWWWRVADGAVLTPNGYAMRFHAVFEQRRASTRGEQYGLTTIPRAAFGPYRFTAGLAAAIPTWKSHSARGPDEQRDHAYASQILSRPSRELRRRAVPRRVQVTGTAQPACRHLLQPNVLRPRLPLVSILRRSHCEYSVVLSAMLGTRPVLA